MFSNDGWSHPPGSNLIGWTRTWGNSRIVYLQCGDDAVAYANPWLRRLVQNAIAWVAQVRQPQSAAG
jgi:type 1 glutamine amidotransferase